MEKSKYDGEFMRRLFRNEDITPMGGTYICANNMVIKPNAETNCLRFQ